MVEREDLFWIEQQGPGFTRESYQHGMRLAWQIASEQAEQGTYFLLLPTPYVYAQLAQQDLYRQDQEHLAKGEKPGEYEYQIDSHLFHFPPAQEAYMRKHPPQPIEDLSPETQEILEFLGVLPTLEEDEDTDDLEIIEPPRRPVNGDDASSPYTMDDFPF